MAQIEPLSQFYDEAYKEFKESKMDEEFSELVQTFRKKAINLLELLDLSIPSVAKLRVGLKLHTYSYSYTVTKMMKNWIFFSQVNNW